MGLGLTGTVDKTFTYKDKEVSYEDVKHGLSMMESSGGLGLTGEIEDKSSGLGLTGEITVSDPREGLSFGQRVLTSKPMDMALNAVENAINFFNKDEVSKKLSQNAQLKSLDTFKEQTEKEHDYMTMRMNKYIAKQSQTNLYSGVPSYLDEFVQGILPIKSEKLEQPGAEHPIARVAGSLVGLIATGGMTAGIAPAVSGASFIEALPTVAQITAGRMAQTGTTFGVKTLIDNIAESIAGKDKNVKEIASETLKAVSFGAGLGGVGTIPTPVLRIPAEASYGFVTAKLEGASTFEAGIQAGLFGLFGLFNTRNLSMAYKNAAEQGAKKAMIDRLIKLGADKAKASEITERYFRYIYSTSGGYDAAKTKDFDQFKKVIRKGGQPYLPKEGALVKARQAKAESEAYSAWLQERKLLGRPTPEMDMPLHPAEAGKEAVKKLKTVTPDESEAYQKKLKEMASNELLASLEIPLYPIEVAKEIIPTKTFLLTGIKPSAPAGTSPKFNNTQEAIAFGKKATPEQVKVLKVSRETVLKQAGVIHNIEKPTDEDIQKGMDLAVEGQFYREAIEASEGRIDKVISKKAAINKPAAIQEPITEQDTTDIKEIKSMSIGWEAGGKLMEGTDPVTGRKIRMPSTFPSELKNIGLTHKHMNTVFNNIEKGKPLTEKQQQTKNLLLSWYKDIVKGADYDTKGLSESETTEVIRKANQDEPISQQDFWEEELREPQAEYGEGLIEQKFIEKVKTKPQIKYEKKSLIEKKKGQWWIGRDWEKEYKEQPIREFEYHRDLIAEGYVPITRKEADFLSDNGEEMLVSHANIRGDKTTGEEGYFMRQPKQKMIREYKTGKLIPRYSEDILKTYEKYKERYGQSKKIKTVPDTRGKDIERQGEVRPITSVREEKAGYEKPSKALIEEAKKHDTVEGFVEKGFIVKPPRKLYRGIMKSGKGAGTFSLGKGLYYKKEKKILSNFKFDEIIELSPQEAFPRNPLVIKSSGGFTDW